MNKWTVFGAVALFFLVIIYLRMEKEREDAAKNRKEHTHETTIDQDD